MQALFKSHPPSFQIKYIPAFKKLKKLAWNESIDAIKSSDPELSKNGLDTVNKIFAFERFISRNNLISDVLNKHPANEFLEYTTSANETIGWFLTSNIRLPSVSQQGVLLDFLLEYVKPYGWLLEKFRNDFITINEELSALVVEISTYKSYKTIAELLDLIEHGLKGVQPTTQGFESVFKTFKEVAKDFISTNFEDGDFIAMAEHLKTYEKDSEKAALSIGCLAFMFEFHEMIKHNHGQGTNMLRKLFVIQAFFGNKNNQRLFELMNYLCIFSENEARCCEETRSKSPESRRNA